MEEKCAYISYYNGIKVVTVYNFIPPTLLISKIFSNPMIITKLLN